MISPAALTEQVRANVEIIREALGVREWAASITPSTHGERVEREMPEAFAALDALAEALAQAESQLADSRSGLRYIEQRYGRLDGVGWDRVLPAAGRDGGQ